MIRFRNMTSVATVSVYPAAHIMQHGEYIMKNVQLQNSQNPGDKDKCKDKQTWTVKFARRSDLIIDRLATESRNQPCWKNIFGHGIISGTESYHFFNNGDFL